MTLNIGQVVNNRYRIARLLCRGGMGAVYRAWDLNLNMAVALKEMIPQAGLEARKLGELRAQFQREAQVLAGLTHPNLPRVTDFFDWMGNSYLVMDFVEGESLGHLIAQQGALPESRVIEWAAQLLSALVACHERSIVHRDIKPQNIIIRPEGYAMLVDFGLVKLWDPRNPQTQHIVRGMGTPEYASPEHFGLAGQHTEPRSDLYSLAATLYHAMSGRETPVALDRWAHATAPTSLRALGVAVHPQLEGVIMRALALNPADRFGSAQEMLNALRTVETVPVRESRVAPPVQRMTLLPQQQPASPSAAKVQSKRWWLETIVGAAIALLGMLPLQLTLRYMNANLYLGRSIVALLLGALGWFLGDLIFQALAHADWSVEAPTGSRPTQRLVALTRRMTRRMTTAQQVGLLAALLVGTAAVVWLLSPLVRSVWFIWNYVPFYAAIGPLAYFATGRKVGRVLIAHVLVVGLGGLLIGARLGLGQSIGPLLLAAVGGGLLMEGVAWAAERLLLRR